MAVPTIDPVAVVAAAHVYIRDKVNAAVKKRIFVADDLLGSIKVSYFLKALAMPDITIQQKYQIYECLIAFTRLYP